MRRPCDQWICYISGVHIRWLSIGIMFLVAIGNPKTCFRIFLRHNLADFVVCWNHPIKLKLKSSESHHWSHNINIISLKYELRNESLNSDGLQFQHYQQKEQASQYERNNNIWSCQSKSRFWTIGVWVKMFNEIISFLLWIILSPTSVQI